MPEGRASVPTHYPQNVTVDIDINVLATRLVKDRAFINAVAKAVLIALTKDARGVGNLFGKWAQKQPPNPASKRRAT